MIGALYAVLRRSACGGGQLSKKPSRGPRRQNNRAPSDRICPTPCATFPRMKRDWIGATMRPQVELIAGFGGAEIVKHLDGRLEIRGGTEQEKTKAHDWMQQFLTQGPLTVRRAR